MELTSEMEMANAWKHNTTKWKQSCHEENLTHVASSVQEKEAMSHLSMLLKSEIRNSDELSDQMSERFAESRQKMLEEEEIAAKLWLENKYLKSEVIELQANIGTLQEENTELMTQPIPSHYAIHTDDEANGDEYAPEGCPPPPLPSQAEFFAPPGTYTDKQWEAWEAQEAGNSNEADLSPETKEVQWQNTAEWSNEWNAWQYDETDEHTDAQWDTYIEEQEESRKQALRDDYNNLIKEAEIQYAPSRDEGPYWKANDDQSKNSWHYSNVRTSANAWQEAASYEYSDNWKVREQQELQAMRAGQEKEEIKIDPWPGVRQVLPWQSKTCRTIAAASSHPQKCYAWIWDVKNAKHQHAIPETPWFATNLEAKIGEAVLNVLPTVLKSIIMNTKKDMEEPRDSWKRAEMMKGSVIFWLALQEQRRDEDEALNAMYEEILHTFIEGNPPSLKNLRQFDKVWFGKLQDAERAGNPHQQWLTAPRYEREILKCPEFATHWKFLTAYGEFRVNKPTQEQNREIVAKFLQEELVRVQKDKDRQQDINAWQRSDTNAVTHHANLARIEVPAKRSIDCTKFYYKGQCAAGDNCPNKHDNSMFPHGKGASRKGGKGGKGKEKGDSKGKGKGKTKGAKGSLWCSVCQKEGNHTKAKCWWSDEAKGQGAGKGKNAEEKGKGKGKEKGKGKGKEPKIRKQPCTFHFTKSGCKQSTSCPNHHAMTCRKWADDKKSCPDQSKCYYLHRATFDPFAAPKAMPAKTQAEEPAPKAKAKTKRANVARVQQDDSVAFTDVKNDCDYPRDES